LPKNKIPIGVKKDVRKKKKQKRIIRESYIDLKEVLPEGISNATQLRELYEEKRNIKKNMHLNLIQGAHQGNLDPWSKLSDFHRSNIFGDFYQRRKVCDFRFS